MTRFARSSGSKGANERRPEEATSWSEMKDAILGKNETDVTNDEVESDEEKLKGEVKLVWAKLVAEDNDSDGFDSSDEMNKSVKSQCKKRKQKNGETKAGKVELDEVVNVAKKVKKLNDNKVEKNCANKIKTSKIKNSPRVAEMNDDGALTNGKIEKIKKGKKAPSYDIETEGDKKKTKEKRSKIGKASTVKISDETERTVAVKRLTDKERRQIETFKIKAEDCGSDTKKKIFTTDSSFNKSSKSKKRHKTDMQEAETIIRNNHCFQSECEDSVKTKKKKRSKFDNSEVPILNEEEDLTNSDNTKVKKRRKAELRETELIINGKPVKVSPFDGFIIQTEDAIRLRKLRVDMTAKGLPAAEREGAIKLERRRAEKALARLKKQVCFQCRKTGHNLSECPSLNQESTTTGICYKCGSTEHTHFQCRVSKDFRYAECFICKEQGHIARSCPDNPRGLYPKGGACSLCGDVTHLRKDCPKHLVQQEESSITAKVQNYRVLESIDEDLEARNTIAKPAKKSNKIIRF